MPVPRASQRHWFAPVEGGLRLAVRLQPGARKTALGGLATLTDGEVVLTARVTAAPEGGKANVALIALLAKSWRLPKSAFEIVAGRDARNKTLLIAGDAARLETRLEAWLRDRATGAPG